MKWSSLSPRAKINISCIHWWLTILPFYPTTFWSPDCIVDISYWDIAQAYQTQHGQTKIYHLYIYSCTFTFVILYPCVLRFSGCTTIHCGVMFDCFSSHLALSNTMSSMALLSLEFSLFLQPHCHCPSCGHSIYHLDYCNNS